MKLKKKEHNPPKGTLAYFLDKLCFKMLKNTGGIQYDEEDKEICSWCGEDCSDGCYTRVDDKPVCDGCKETL